MNIAKESSNIFTLNNRFGGSDLTFTIDVSAEGKRFYSVDFVGVEMMLNEDELYDLLEMLKAAYKIAVEEEGKDE